MRYCVKNCPCYIDDYWNFKACKNGCVINGTYVTRCDSVGDCLLKQIVEKCEKNKFVGYGAIEIEIPLYREIIQMLEIEVVNE